MCICDEAAFMPEKVITRIVFPMLSTTDGYAIFLSTPWGRDHFFYHAFVDPIYSVHKVRSSECPLIKPEFLEEMRQNMTHEAYVMEYEAEFIEALNSFFSQSLIRSCVELAQKNNVEPCERLETLFPAGDYYCGVDFGKLQDYSVMMVLRREGDILKLVYMYQFPLETSYTRVIGHLVRANQKFQFRSVLVDQTGVGEPVLEEIRNQGVRNVDGIKFTVQTKEELLTSLKIAMEQNRLAIPYNKRLCEQINEQQFEYSKSGHLQFSHPENSHDDMLWALSLSCFASTRVPPPGKGAVMLPH
jgi:phage FluMu gp28-like protein